MSNVVFVRFIPALLALVLLPVLASCGSSGAAGGAAAAVPEDVAVYVSLDTSFESGQWRAVSDLLGRFPDGEGALERFLDEATAESGLPDDVELRDVVGPEVAFAILSGPTGADGEPPVVILTQPEDVDAFQQLLEEDDAGMVGAEVNGWQVLAYDEGALDAYRAALDGPSLEDSDLFDETMDDLSGDALAHLYVNGEALAQAVPELPADLGQSPFELIPGADAGSIGAELRVEDDGVRVDGRLLATGEETLPRSEPYEAELIEEVPAGAVAFLSFNDLGSALSEYADMLGGEAATGPLPFDLDEVGGLLSGEIAVYVRPGPAVTLVAQVEDEAAALQTVEGLVALAGGELPIVYEAFDGLLAVSSSREELDALRGDGPRLDQDDAFAEALDAAGMPDETTGFAYVDIQAAVPLLLGLEGAGPHPPAGYLEPLGGAVAWGSRSGDVQRFSVFLSID